MVAWILGSVALASTWTVCETGCDFDEIQLAIDTATGGDVVEVASGTWDENLQIREAITLRGEGAQNTVIDGGFRRGVISIFDPGGPVTIEGFTLRNATMSSWTPWARAGAGGIHMARATEVLVRGCSIVDNGVGIVVQDPAPGGAYDLRVENTLIADNRTSGLLVWEGDRVEIVQSAVVGNGRFGLNFYEGAGSHLIENTVLTRNLEAAVYVGLNASVEMNHNLVAGNYQSYLWDPPGDINRYGVFGDPGGTGNLLDLSPRFTESLCRDVRPRPQSPLIDAGHPGLLDLDGSRSDIGPYGGAGGDVHLALATGVCVDLQLPDAALEIGVPISAQLGLLNDLGRDIAVRGVVESRLGTNPVYGSNISEEVPRTRFVMPPGFRSGSFVFNPVDNSEGGLLCVEVVAVGSQRVLASRCRAFKAWD